MDSFELVRTEFICSDTSLARAISRRTEAVFTDVPGSTANQQVEAYLARVTPATRFYLGWDGRIYPRWTVRRRALVTPL